jgi:hypothetical protein
VIESSSGGTQAIHHRFGNQPRGFHAAKTHRLIRVTKIREQWHGLTLVEGIDFQGGNKNATWNAPAETGSPTGYDAKSRRISWKRTKSCWTRR